MRRPCGAASNRAMRTGNAWLVTSIFAISSLCSCSSGSDVRPDRSETSAGGVSSPSGGAGNPAGGADNPVGGAPSGAGGMPSGGGGNAPTAGSGGDGSMAGAGGAVEPKPPLPPGSPATDLVASWKLGWNLGNSLDVPTGETDWGNPAITPELLQAVANTGIGVVRIPVTWSLFTGAGPTYTIDAARLARVEEVVGYAHAAGLTAIINVHHDGADNWDPPSDGVEWLTLDDMSGAVEERFQAVWEQIATHFANHDTNLVFESMNEIHDGYPSIDNPPPQAQYDMINRLNQLFVDVVRQAGGQNPDRYLIVPGYNTNIDLTLDGFVLPNDSTPDHLILSVHYYDPYTFALTGETQTWGSASPNNDGWGQEDFVVTQFDKLVERYVSQGQPVIIGEYGATNQDGGDYRRYYLEYVTKVAADRGIVPIYWDNGGTGTGAENLGLFDRSSNSVAFPAILDALVRAATSEYSLDQVAPPASN